MTSYFYEYLVKFFDDVCENEKQVTGITYGTDLCDAINRITGFYGETIMELSIREVEEGDVREMKIDW